MSLLFRGHKGLRSTNRQCRGHEGLQISNSTTPLFRDKGLCSVLWQPRVQRRDSREYKCVGSRVSQSSWWRAASWESGGLIITFFMSRISPSTKFNVSLVTAMKLSNSAILFHSAADRQCVSGRFGESIRRRTYFTFIPVCQWGHVQGQVCNCRNLLALQASRLLEQSINFNFFRRWRWTVLFALVGYHLRSLENHITPFRICVTYARASL